MPFPLPERGCPLLSLLFILFFFGLASHPSGAFSRMSHLFAVLSAYLNLSGNFFTWLPFKCKYTNLHLPLWWSHYLQAYVKCLYMVFDNTKILTVVSCTILIGLYSFSRQSNLDYMLINTFVTYRCHGSLFWLQCFWTRVIHSNEHFLYLLKILKPRNTQCPQERLISKTLISPRSLGKRISICKQ